VGSVDFSAMSAVTRYTTFRIYRDLLRVAVLQTHLVHFRAVGCELCF